MCSMLMTLLLLRASIAIPGGPAHSAIELFPDESIKLTVPAIMLELDAYKKAVDELKQDGIEIVPGARFIGATRTLKRVTRMASILDRYVRERGISWTSYAVAYELENMEGVMLWSEKETYPHLYSQPWASVLRNHRWTESHSLLRRWRTQFIPCASICRKPFL